VFDLANLILEKKEIERLAQSYEFASPTEIVRVAIEQIRNLTLACSFGAEDMVLVDILMNLNPDANVFYLDTNVLFEETYALRDEAIRKYGMQNIRQVLPEMTLAEQAARHGEALWKSNPNACCDIRKVQPLTKALAQYDGWITGIRRDQAPTRAYSQAFEADTKFGLVKVNPLIRWTQEQVWAYIQQNDVPYNPLHDQGYPSIGCIHCTRAIAPGEDPRAGRWSGFEKTECGLHR